MYVHTTLHPKKQSSIYITLLLLLLLKILRLRSSLISKIVEVIVAFCNAEGAIVMYINSLS